MAEAPSSEHFDAIDDAHRNRVEVGGAGYAGRRGFVHPTDAIDEDQHAFAAETAQVDLRRAGADAAAIGRVTEVAGRIELRVERLAAGGYLLQQLADAGETGLVDRGAVDDGKGLLGVGAGLDDA